MPSIRNDQGDEIQLAQERGTVVHLLIAATCERFGARASADDVTSVALGQLRANSQNIVMNRSRLAYVETAAAAYFHWFSPHGWNFIGAEVIRHGVAFDLVWERDGRVLADELKSGLGSLGPGDQELRAQLESQAEAGFAEWGESFAGVRAVLLGGIDGSHEIEEKDLVRT